jgi:hypothetical protein
VEGYPLEDFSAEAVRNQIAEEQKIASGGGSEQDIAEAKIALEVSRVQLSNSWHQLTFLTGFGESSSFVEVKVCS